MFKMPHHSATGADHLRCQLKGLNVFKLKRNEGTEAYCINLRAF